MKIIAAVDKNWAIGSENELLFRIPEDMKYFKMVTTNKIVVMGRKTFESLGLLGGLPNRENWVITSDSDYQEKYPKIKVFNSIEDVFNHINNENISTSNIMIIGGGKIYKEFLPYCSECLITQIDEKPKNNPDVYFPLDLDESKVWKLAFSATGKDCVRLGIKYKFNIYENEYTKSIPKGE